MPNVTQKPTLVIEPRDPVCRPKWPVRPIGATIVRLPRGNEADSDVSGERDLLDPTTLSEREKAPTRSAGFFNALRTTAVAFVRRSTIHRYVRPMAH